MEWISEECEFDSRREQEIILVYTAFRPALGPTQSRI
jgi:hypothetical protein